MLAFIGVDDGLTGWGWVGVVGFFIAFIAFNLWRRRKSGHWAGGELQHNLACRCLASSTPCSLSSIGVHTSARSTLTA